MKPIPRAILWAVVWALAFLILSRALGAFQPNFWLVLAAMTVFVAATGIANYVWRQTAPKKDMTTAPLYDGKPVERNAPNLQAMSDDDLQFISETVANNIREKQRETAALELKAAAVAEELRKRGINPGG